MTLSAHRKCFLLVRVVSIAFWALSATYSAAQTFQSGDLLLSDDFGRVQWRDSLGAHKQTINTTDARSGSRCNPITGELWATTFGHTPAIRLIDTSGNINGGINAHNQRQAESVVFDSLGNGYVGGVNRSDLDQFDKNGQYLRSWVIPNPYQRIDWIDICSDERTLFYTDEYSLKVKRFDLLTSTPLPDFADLTGVAARPFAVRVLPDATVLVADGGMNVFRLNQFGQVMRTYTVPGTVATFFALALTPDAASFWVGGFQEYRTLYKFDIATGNIQHQFDPGGFLGPNINGIAVYGDNTRGECPPVPEPSALVGLGLGTLLVLRRTRSSSPLRH